MAKWVAAVAGLALLVGSSSAQAQSGGGGAGGQAGGYGGQGATDCDDDPVCRPYDSGSTPIANTVSGALLAGWMGLGAWRRRRKRGS